MGEEKRKTYVTREKPRGAKEAKKRETKKIRGKRTKLRNGSNLSQHEGNANKYRSRRHHKANIKTNRYTRISKMNDKTRERKREPRGERGGETGEERRPNKKKVTKKHPQLIKTFGNAIIW